MPRDNPRLKLTMIADPIAEGYWGTSQIKVGRPHYLPKERLWYCPLMIDGALKDPFFKGLFPGIRPIFGMEQLDALVNAMSLVRRFFEEHPLPPSKRALPQTSLSRPRHAGETKAKSGKLGAPPKKQSKKTRKRRVQQLVTARER